MLGGSASSLSPAARAISASSTCPSSSRPPKLCKKPGCTRTCTCAAARESRGDGGEESEVDVIEPLEEPPGGDVDIAEMKKRYGSKVCLKGNINTFDFMLNATPQQVEEKPKRLIDECAPGGGFVLSTGDQCGRDTPDANLFNWSKSPGPRARFINRRSHYV
jgi:uroporphyrinogen-III decarboxylase